MKIFVFLLLIPFSLYSYFENHAITADGAASANIITAVNSMSSFINYNPASLSRVREINAGTTFVKNYWGLNISLKDKEDFLNNYQVSCSIPVMRKSGVLGLNFWQLSTAYYYERIYSAGWGYPIIKSFSLGIAVDFYNWGLSDNDYIRLNDYFNSKTGSAGLGFNVGFEYNDIKELKLGIVFKNINQPDLGLKEEENLPFLIETGITKRINYQIRVSAGLTYNKDLFTAAVAYNQFFFNNLLSFKSGLKYMKYQDISSLYKLNLGTGFNFKYSVLFTLFYSFNYPLNGMYNHYGNHMFSLNIKF